MFADELLYVRRHPLRVVEVDVVGALHPHQREPGVGPVDVQHLLHTLLVLVVGTLRGLKEEHVEKQYNW